MSEKHEDVLPFRRDPFRQFAVEDFYALEHLFVCDIQALESLNEDVAQIVIELLLDGDDFLQALFGKRTAQVLSDKATPIPYYIIYDGKRNVAEQVQNAQGQLSKKPHQVVFLLRSVFVHLCSVSQNLPNLQGQRYK
jgi:hypothetical protein